MVQSLSSSLIKTEGFKEYKNLNLSNQADLRAQAYHHCKFAVEAEAGDQDSCQKDDDGARGLIIDRMTGMASE